MKYHYLIAKRYLKPPKGNKFQLFITLLSIGGVAVGVATLITVISVMNGLHNDIQEKIIGVNAHILVSQGFAISDSAINDINEIIENNNKLKNEVTGVTPFIFSKVMIKSKNFVDGVLLRGYDLETSEDVTNIEEKIIEGKFLGKTTIEGLMPLVLGNILARNLEVEIGDIIEVYSILSSTITPIGPVPKIFKTEVVGIIDAGLYEYNSSWIFMEIGDVKKMLKLQDSITGYQISIKNVMNARKISKILQEDLGYSYIVQDWLMLNRNLFEALKLEKIVMAIILFMIVIVAAFNIIATLIMIVIQKTKEIGILRSIGLKKSDVMKIFLFQGTIMGGIGTILGLILGLLLCWVLGQFEFPIDTDVYVISSLPIAIDYFDIFIICAISIFISFLSTVYPAYKASTLIPVEALRYE